MYVLHIIKTVKLYAFCVAANAENKTKDYPYVVKFVSISWFYIFMIVITYVTMMYIRTLLQNVCIDKIREKKNGVRLISTVW
jgi:hypothetical protein